LELYIEINITLSKGAIYIFNLYKLETPLGVSTGQDLEVGIVFIIDVILNIEAEINISNGFYIQLNNGVAINIPLFGQNISIIIL
jgi:hypothetical protein